MSQKSYSNNIATLYIIPTPVGNMEDITIRSLNTLKEVDVIFCEDTRVTKQLLSYFDIDKKLISCHKFTENIKLDKVIEYLNKNKKVGLVSDRGTPIISDPGYEIAKGVIDAGYNVVSLPGATAFVPALTMSGLIPQPFLFYGFLNSKSSKRKDELNNIKDLDSTIIFYEAPHRLIDTLNDIKEVLGNRQISISREISKKFEEVYRGAILDVIEEVGTPKGEFVIVVDGNHDKENYDEITVNDHVNIYIREGYSVMDAIKKVAKERNVSKNEIYSIYHNLK